MEIRPFQASDQALIQTFLEDSEADLSVSTPDDYFDDLKAVATAYEGGAFFVAVDGTTLIGIGGLSPKGEVVRIRVSSTHRRKGVASGILEAILNAAVELKFDELFLHTAESQQAACRLYEAAGFEESARGELFGNRVIAYKKRLR